MQAITQVTDELSLDNATLLCNAFLFSQCKEHEAEHLKDIQSFRENIERLLQRGKIHPISYWYQQNITWVVDALCSCDEASKNSLQDVFLRESIEHGQNDMAMSLLRHGCPPEATNKHGQNALYLAAYHGLEAIVTTISQQQPKLLQSQSNTNETIYHACAKGADGLKADIDTYKCIIKLAKQHDISLNQRNNDGHFPYECTSNPALQDLLGKPHPQQRQREVPVDELRQRLVKMYEHNTTLPTLFSNVETNVGELYIPLAMLDDEALSKQQAQTERSTQSYLSKENQHLKWSELFYDKQKKQTFQRVIVRGLAGSGKTTLNRRIAWEWCQPQARGPALLGRFDWVFWLPLRSVQLLLSEKDQGRNLGEFVYDLYFSSDILDESGQAYERNNIIASLNKLICQNGPNTLWLLDGYDEINRNHLKAFENRLLERLKECGATFLLTSRPSAKISAQVQSDRQVTTRGFTWEELQQYVKVFYQRQAATQVNWQELAQGLVSFLKQQPRLQQLGFTPINAELICCLWQQRQAQVSDLEREQLKHATLTSLYTAVTEYLLRRHLTYCHESGKTWEIEGQPQPYDEENRRLWTSSVVFRANKTLLQVSELLAFLSFTMHAHKEKDIVILPTALRQTRNLMKINDMSMGKHIINLCRIGVLHPTSDVVKQDLKRHYDKISDSSINYLEQSYEFMHLSFQEMLVGRFIARKYRKKNTLPVAGQAQTIQQWFANNKWEPSYQLVWEFTAGHLAQYDMAQQPKGNHAVNFIQHLFDMPRDLTRRTEALLLMRMAEESFAVLAKAQQTSIAEYLGEIYSKVIVDIRFDTYLKSFSQILNQCYLLKQQPKFFQSVSQLLSHKNNWVRRRAVDALRHQSSLPEDILNNLVERLTNNEESDIRRPAAYALGYQSSLPDDILKSLVERLTDKGGDVRRRAADALGQQSSLPEDILKCLVERLTDKDSYVRRRLTDALGYQSLLPEDILKSLVKHLSDEDSTVRSRATDALGQQSSLPEDILIRLAERLTDEDRYVRHRAADALGHQSSLPEDILIRLAERLTDEDRYVRRSAADALGHQSSLPEDILIRLAERLTDEDSDVRRRAADALGHQSWLPEDILIRLAEHLTDEYSDVRHRAADALSHHSLLPADIKSLVKRLTDEDRYVRSRAVYALGKQSSLPEDILIRLAERLTDEDSDVRHCAADALGHQSPLPEEILKSLVKRLTDKDGYVCHRAADALGKQSSLPEDILINLAEHLTDEDRYVRRCAADALAMQASQVLSSISDLCNALKLTDTSQMTVLTAKIVIFARATIFYRNNSSQNNLIQAVHKKFNELGWPALPDKVTLMNSSQHVAASSTTSREDDNERSTLGCSEFIAP